MFLCGVGKENRNGELVHIELLNLYFKNDMK